MFKDKITFSRSLPEWFVSWRQPGHLRVKQRCCVQSKGGLLPCLATVPTTAWECVRLPEGTSPLGPPETWLCQVSVCDRDSNVSPSHPRPKSTPLHRRLTPLSLRHQIPLPSPLPCAPLLFSPATWVSMSLFPSFPPSKTPSKSRIFNAEAPQDMVKERKSSLQNSRYCIIPYLFVK